MRILTITNLYPNPYQPHRATFNRDELRALAEEHAVAVIAPIAWTDELRARWKVGRLLPINRRVGCDGLDVHHPRYLYTPRVLRHCYGAFFRGSIRHAFNQALDQFRPEMVYAPWAYPDGWAAMHLAHQAGLPAIVKVHGSDVRLLDSYPDRLKRTAEVCRGPTGSLQLVRTWRGVSSRWKRIRIECEPSTAPLTPGAFIPRRARKRWRGLISPRTAP